MMIEVQNLCKRFGADAAVDGVSFSAEKGERIAIVGRNGAGKTTLLRLLATFLPATSGSISIGGADPLAGGALIRDRIGYLPEGAPLDPEMFVAEYLRFRGKLRRMPRGTIRRRIRELVSFCGLAPLRASLIGTLSAGQRHAVGLADAILHEPDILLFDDPMAATDPVQAEKFTALLSSPSVSKNRVLLFSSHDSVLVHSVATRILFLENGRLVRDERNVPGLNKAPLPELFRRWLATAPSPESAEAADADATPQSNGTNTEESAAAKSVSDAPAADIKPERSSEPNPQEDGK